MSADALPTLEKVGGILTAHNYITTSVGCLAIYNHLITFDDEVSYVWQKKKSWISYLFILNRYLLLCYAIFVESTAQQTGRVQCTRNIFAASTLGLTVLLFSDIFLAMRVYSVTGQSRLIGLYLSCLICAKAIVSYYFAFGIHINAVPLPDIPFPAFKACHATSSMGVQITMHAIGASLDISAFGIIVWFACSNVGIYRFSSLFKTVVSDATVYFIMVMCIQTLVLFFLSFADPTMGQYPVIFYSVLVPTLINRFVLSLRKTADTKSTDNRAWNTGHFSNMRFGATSMTATSEAAVGLPRIETLSDTDDHNDIPLGHLTPHKRPQSPAGTSGVASQSVV